MNIAIKKNGIKIKSQLLKSLLIKRPIIGTSINKKIDY